MHSHSSFQEWGQDGVAEQIFSCHLSRHLAMMSLKQKESSALIRIFHTLAFGHSKSTNPKVNHSQGEKRKAKRVAIKWRASPSERHNIGMRGKMR